MISLLFTNAGMVQFKRTFGEERALSSCDQQSKVYTSWWQTQRPGNVGRTARHHTFSRSRKLFVRDYFKKEAIEYAWDFLTEVLGLPKDKLYATIHEGDQGMKLGPDDEAGSFWARYLPSERIRRSHQGQFLGHGRHRAVWACSRSHRPGPGRVRPTRLPTGL